MGRVRTRASCERIRRKCVPAHVFIRNADIFERVRRKCVLSYVVVGNADIFARMLRRRAFNGYAQFT